MEPICSGAGVAADRVPFFAAECAIYRDSPASCTEFRARSGQFLNGRMLARFVGRLQSGQCRFYVLHRIVRRIGMPITGGFIGIRKTRVFCHLNSLF